KRASFGLGRNSWLDSCDMGTQRRFEPDPASASSRERNRARRSHSAVHPRNLHSHWHSLWSCAGTENFADRLTGGLQTRWPEYHRRPESITARFHRRGVSPVSCLARGGWPHASYSRATQRCEAVIQCP